LRKSLTKKEWLGRESNPRAKSWGFWVVISGQLQRKAVIDGIGFVTPCYVDMASHYTRTDSPFYWLRVQLPDGTWGAKSSGIRIDSPGAIRKAKQKAAEETMREHQSDSAGASNRFDGWVPGYLSGRYLNPKTVTRYLNAWSALATYFTHRGIIAPAEVTYKVCTDYPAFRTAPPKKLMRARSANTALTELKVLSAIV